MKKLLVLALVCGMASLASAGLTVTGLDLNLVDNGDGTCGIESLTAYAGGKDIYYVVVGMGVPTGGSVLAAAPGAPLPSGSSINEDAVNAGGVAWLPVGMNGVWGYIGDADSVGKPAGVWIDGIAFTGEVFLYEINANWDGFTTAEPISRIVPEPMTMVLLGLGGLFLRKRS